MTKVTVSLARKLGISTRTLAEKPCYFFWDASQEDFDAEKQNLVNGPGQINPDNIGGLKIA